MAAAQAGIATTGHNITNATTEGYSRQRVHQASEAPNEGIGSKGLIGKGTKIDRVERVNDTYLEKQVRNAGKELAHAEEKDMALRQIESVFNEMGGEGLNRIVSKFFNEFRKLANEPSSTAIRSSVREGAQAMVNDLKRLRSEVEDIRRHLDSRLEGYTREINSYAEQIRDLNIQIKKYDAGGASPNDLQDKRDQALKKLTEYMDLAMHADGDGNYVVDVKGVGPLVVGPNAEKFSVVRSPADVDGKPEGAFDLKTSASANGIVTHGVKGGKIGALLEVRDKTLSTVLDRLDDIAYGIAQAVNSVHEQGVTSDGMTGIKFFKMPVQRERAAEFLDLSADVKANVNAIAAAQVPDAPSDNRIALAISQVQGLQFMNDGKSTLDDFYNAIVSDVGVATNRNRSTMNAVKDSVTQLGKFREQLSGVSIDEETTNLLQYQHAFGASAKVIQVADEMLKTILELKR